MASKLPSKSLTRRRVTSNLPKGYPSLPAHAYPGYVEPKFTPYPELRIKAPRIYTLTDCYDRTSEIYMKLNAQLLAGNYDLEGWTIAHDSELKDCVFYNQITGAKRRSIEQVKRIEDANPRSILKYRKPLPVVQYNNKKGWKIPAYALPGYENQGPRFNAGLSPIQGNHEDLQAKLNEVLEKRGYKGWTTERFDDRSLLNRSMGEGPLVYFYNEELDKRVTDMWQIPGAEATARAEALAKAKAKAKANANAKASCGPGCSIMGGRSNRKTRRKALLLF